jgi:hypothetical protein
VNIRTTIILLLIFLALGAYYVFVERNKPSERELEQIEKTALDIDRAAIESLELRLEGEDIRCVKAGEEWEMRRPVEAGCDETLIASILESLSPIRAERFIELGSESAGQYGLDNPDIEISVASSSPPDSHWIMIGDKTPTGDTYFAFVDTRDRIALLPASAIDGKMRATAFDFRDKTVLDFEVAQARVLDITYDDTQIIVERAFEEPWEITTPIQGRGDETEINSILWDIENAKVREFIDDPDEDLAAYGLDKPAATARILIGAGKSLRRLDFGKETEDGGLVYAKRTLHDNIVLVDKRLMEKVQAELVDLREKRLMQFAADDVAAIDIVMGDSTFSCARDTSGEWVTAAPANMPLKKWKMNGVASQLSFLRAFSFVDDPNPNTRRMGLDAPQLSVTVSLADSGAATLNLGTADGDEVYIYANGQYATVSSGFMDDLKDILRNPPYVEEETTDERVE